MTNDLYLYLLVDLIISFLAFLLVNRTYKINGFKLFVFNFVSIILGVISTMMMSYIESGSFKGTSFYGAVFLLPIFTYFLSLIFNISSWKLFNLSSILVMITSAILKVRCFVYGCCGGRKIPIETDYGFMDFPSQIVEMIFALLIFILLLFLFFRNKDRKDLYPIMMIVYGVGRFILNSYRLVVPLFGFMSFGHIWSIISVIVGIIWLIILHKKKIND